MDSFLSWILFFSLWPFSALLFFPPPKCSRGQNHTCGCYLVWLFSEGHPSPFSYPVTTAYHLVVRLLLTYFSIMPNFSSAPPITLPKHVMSFPSPHPPTVHFLFSTTMFSPPPCVFPPVHWVMQFEFFILLGTLEHNDFDPRESFSFPP